MRIYLDTCCLNRPFDEQSQIRIHLESEAVKAILSQCDQGYWELVVSTVVHFEIDKMSNEEQRQQVILFLEPACQIIKPNEAMICRAEAFESAGIQVFDALHLACAEHNADIFLTVDDKFLKKCRRLSDLAIKVGNPLFWLDEVLQ